MKTIVADYNKTRHFLSFKRFFIVTDVDLSPRLKGCYIFISFEMIVLMGKHKNAKDSKQ